MALLLFAGLFLGLFLGLLELIVDALGLLIEFRPLFQLLEACNAHLLAGLLHRLCPGIFLSPAALPLADDAVHASLSLVSFSVHKYTGAAADFDQVVSPEAACRHLGSAVVDLTL